MARKGRRRRRRERRGKITELMTLTTTPSVLSGVFLSSLCLSRVVVSRSFVLSFLFFFFNSSVERKGSLQSYVGFIFSLISPPASSGVPSCVVAGFRVVKQEQKNPGYGGLGFCLVDVGKFTWNPPPLSKSVGAVSYFVGMVRSVKGDFVEKLWLARVVEEGPFEETHFWPLIVC